MNIERKLIEHCAPTLAGIKTANMFTAKFCSEDILCKQISKLNQVLNEKRVNIMVLRTHSDTALIYTYREEMLKVDMTNEKAKNILHRYGYDGLTCSEAIERLVGRLQAFDKTNSFENFPHEVGLFLGYPPEDVEGFICNRGMNYHLCGCWKVYGDADKASIGFARYKKCKKVYKKLWDNGRDIFKLTVKKKQLTVA